MSSSVSRAIHGRWLPFLAIVYALGVFGFGFLKARAEEPSALRATIDIEQLRKIDDAVNEAIKRGELPGAVVLVVHHGETVYRKAFGHRMVKPSEAPMQVETLFDLASLTKPVATATSLMILIERGKIKPSDRVSRYLPDFANNGKEKVTIEQLLLHTSGLTADNPIADYEQGPDKAWSKINDLPLEAEPGTRFRYSDVGYIVLGRLIEKLAGQPLNEFAQENIFKPLGMKETCFRPDGKLKERIAPCDKRGGEFIQGEVHDPRAFQLGGVAGHAGLFSTADDLAMYVNMLLNGGDYKGVRVLSPLSVRLMTTPHDVRAGAKVGQRSFGWDVDTPFSSNRGDLFPPGESFGHTGFTGTSLWIDPATKTAVIFLSNRLHPDGKGNVNRLRGQVATLVAASLRGTELAKTPSGVSTPRLADSLLTGIDVLVKENFVRLKGKHVGLVTNHTGLDQQGRTTIGLLPKADGVDLVALFSPEHGIRGAADDKVSDGKDERTGLPIYSLYGARRKPTALTLKGIDTLLFDVQDAGCRFYTYISTLGLVMEAAADNKIQLIVLDRPNPLGGIAVEGPILDAGRESFVGYHALPVRHGLTVGELARLFNAEKKLSCDLEVVCMQGWRRSDLFDQTGRRWINPSPNLRSLTAALLYPGVGLLETTNVSVGRGTDRPFEWIGAPWLDGQKLADLLMKQGVPGFRCVPMQLTPASSVFKGKACDGINLIVSDWKQFHSLDVGLALASSLYRLYPDTWQVDRFNDLLGNRATLESLKNGASWRELKSAWQPELDAFIKRRRPYLLYPE
ncbi:MAG: exo-beta-N-acetylmuramidase NamZ domain-containing protein [Gemmataceae bacterium]